MMGGTCPVCGVAVGLCSNGVPRRRCKLHRYNIGPVGGRYDARIAALVPRDGVPVDQYELARMIGCTRGYVWMIESAALRKLRERAPWLVDMLRAS